MQKAYHWRIFTPANNQTIWPLQWWIIAPAFSTTLCCCSVSALFSKGSFVKNPFPTNQASQVSTNNGVVGRSA